MQRAKTKHSPQNNTSDCRKTAHLLIEPSLSYSREEKWLRMAEVGIPYICSTCDDSVEDGKQVKMNWHDRCFLFFSLGWLRVPTLQLDDDFPHILTSTRGTGVG
jgi:hypothetical protein